MYIKEAQTLGIKLSEIVNLKDGNEDFDWVVVSDFLIGKQQDVESEIRQLEQQREKILKYRQSIDMCVKGVDSDL